MRSRGGALTTADKITLSALLLSDDADLTDVVCDVAAGMQIEVEACTELVQATRKIAARKYQGVMLDWNQDVGSPALLNAIRASTSNASDVVFALVSSGDQALAATHLGANFIIPPPVTPESVVPYIRAGYGLMVHELRRYFRCPVVLPVRLERRDGSGWGARTLNVSRGGLAVISGGAPLTIGERLLASFEIPGAIPAQDMPVTVCWLDAIGRAGLKYERISPNLERGLEEWLASMIDERLAPGAS